MSDANRTQLSIVEEVTAGTTPASPRFEPLRITGSNLSYNVNTVESNELRADRQVTDVIRVGFEAGGDIPMEASFGALDTGIRGAMQSEWGFTPVRDNDGTADSQITDVTATQLTFLTAAGTPSRINAGAFALGHLVRTSGFTNAGNNGLRRASAATATTVSLAGGTIEAAPPGTARAKVVGFEGVSGDITATASGLAATTLNFTTLGLFVGQWLKVGGSAAGEQFNTVANNGFVRISAIAAGALTFDILPTGWGVDAGTGKTIRVWMADVIRNGTTKRSYTLEQQYQDLTTPEFDYYRGMVFGSWALNSEVQSILNSTFGLMGLSMTNQTTRFAGASDLAAVTGEVLNTSSNVGIVRENGTPVSGPNFVMSASITLDNTLRRQNSLGTVGSHAIGLGRVRVTGTLSTYYGSNALVNKLRNQTASSFDVAFTEANGPNGSRGYIVDLPRVKFTEGSPTVPGVDSDRMLELGMTALRHPTLGCTIQVARFEEFAQ